MQSKIHLSVTYLNFACVGLKCYSVTVSFGFVVGSSNIV